MEEQKEDSISSPLGREDEVSLFNVLPHDLTDGTAFDYYIKFPYMPEEMYYILQCATRNDADPNEVITLCQDIVDKRNDVILSNFGKGNDELVNVVPFNHGENILIDLFIKDQYECPDISQLEICRQETKWEQEE